MKYCQNCGAELKEGKKFCINCGAEVAKMQEMILPAENAPASAEAENAPAAAEPEAPAEPVSAEPESVMKPAAKIQPEPVQQAQPAPEKRPAAARRPAKKTNLPIPLIAGAAALVLALVLGGVFLLRGSGSKSSSGGNSGAAAAKEAEAQPAATTGSEIVATTAAPKTENAKSAAASQKESAKAKTTAEGTSAETEAETDRAVAEEAEEAHEPGWYEEPDGWKYYMEDGKPVKNDWFEDTDGRWYYFDKDGFMMRDMRTPDGYLLGSDGAMIDEKSQNADANASGAGAGGTGTAGSSQSGTASSYVYSSGGGLASKGNTSGVNSKVDLISMMANQTMSGDYEQNGGQVIDHSGRVLKNTISTGDRYMDPVMHEVGYSDYRIEYYYDNPDYSDTVTSEGPNYAHCVIDNNVYDYYYYGNQMILRVGPDGTFTNMEVNRFLDEVWQIGRYYRNQGSSGTASASGTASSANASGQETRRLMFIVMDPENDIKEDQDRVVIDTRVYEPEMGTVKGTEELHLIVDKETVFDKEDNSGYDNIEDGDQPLDWYLRNLHMGENDTVSLNPYQAMAGIFDVEITGNHVDKFYSSYWWD